MANKDKVEIQGGGDLDGAVFKNAATEDTLKKLVDLLEKQKKGTGDKAEKLHKKAVEENIEAIEESTIAQNEYYRDLASLDKKTKEFKSTLAEISGMGVGLAFSLITSAGKSLANFFLDGFDAFKETSKVGAGFNNSIIDLRRAAAEAAMPLDMFVETIQKNSQAFAGLSGNVSNGARDFGIMAKQFRESEIGEQLMGMGFSIGELNNLLAEQIEIDMRGGKLRGKDSATLRKETESYVMQLDQLTKMTGLSREELQKGLKQAMKDGRILTMQSRLSGDALANFKTSMSLMNANIDPGMMNSLTSMMSGVIDPADDFAKQLAIAVPGIQGFEQAVGQGKLSINDQIKGYKDQSKAISAYLSTFSKEVIDRNAGLQKLAQYNASIQNLIDGNSDAALSQQSAMSKITKALGNFSEIVNKLVGNVLVKIVDSPAFKRITNGLEQLAAVFLENSGKIEKLIMPMIDSFLNGLGNMIDGLTMLLNEGDFSADNIKDYFIGIFEKISDGVTKAIGSVFSGFGETPEQKAKKEAYARATPEEKKKMEAEDPSLKSTGLFDSMKKGLESLISLVPSLGNLALFFGVTGGGALVAGLGIGAGLSAVAKGLAELAAPALALGAAIGIGAGGLGLAFEGLSHVIKEITDVFPKLTGFFKSMVEVDPAKLSSAGTSLGPLADNLIKLAGGGVVALLGAGGLDTLSVSLTKMASLDVAKLVAIGPALESVHTGLAAFSSKGFLDSLTDSLAEFASGKGMQSVTESLQNITKVDFSKLDSVASIGTLLDSLKPFLNADIVQRLPESMNTVKGALASFSDFAQKDLSNLDKSKNTIASFSDSFSKISQIDINSIQNTVSGLSKVNTTINDNFTNQSKGVEDYIKSIDKLTVSLTKLEEQIKDMPSTTTASATTGTNAARVITASSDISGNSPDDLQRQLNTKIDDLISHIVEMKQNTKDTADSLSGRRSAV